MVLTFPWMEMRLTTPPLKKGSEAELQQRCADYLRTHHSDVPFKSDLNGARLSGGKRTWIESIKSGNSAGA